MACVLGVYSMPCIMLPILPARHQLQHARSHLTILEYLSQLLPAGSFDGGPRYGSVCTWREGFLNLSRGTPRHRPHHGWRRASGTCQLDISVVRAAATRPLLNASSQRPGRDQERSNCANFTMSPAALRSPPLGTRTPSISLASRVAGRDTQDELLACEIPRGEWPREPSVEVVRVRIPENQ